MRPTCRLTFAGGFSGLLTFLAILFVLKLNLWNAGAQPFPLYGDHEILPDTGEAGNLEISGDLTVHGDAFVDGVPWFVEGQWQLGEVDVTTPGLLTTYQVISQIPTINQLLNAVSANGAAWTWEFRPATGQQRTQMALSGNALVIYDVATGNATVTLSGAPATASQFAGPVNFSAGGVTISNQTAAGSTSVLTVGLGDVRYVVPGTVDRLALGAGTSAGANSLATFGSTASGGAAAAIGYSQATGYQAFAAGTSIASSQFAFATGTGTAANDFAFSHGAYSDATGKHSVAIGWDANAAGDYSVVLGKASGAAGAYGIAMGEGSSANGSYSVAIGYSTLGGGPGAVAMGYDTTTAPSKRGAVAFGETTAVNASWAVAFGLSTIANANNQMVLGRFNFAEGSDVWTSTDPLLVAGNGTSDTSRSNAFVVKKNGEAAFLRPVRVPPGGDLSMGDFTAGTDPREELDPNHLHWTPPAP